MREGELGIAKFEFDEGVLVDACKESFFDFSEEDTVAVSYLSTVVSDTVKVYFNGVEF